MNSAIKSVVVEKPAEFLDAEREASIYWQSLGFDTPAAVHYLREGRALDTIGLREPKHAIAMCDAASGEIYVRQKMIEERWLVGGRPEIAGILVHEKAHSIEAAQNLNDPNLFLAEGFASFHEAWYRRTTTDKMSPPVVIREPSNPLPNNYIRLDCDGVPDERYISGPDGYAMELLGFSAEQKRIMPASQFIACLLEARRPETHLAAMREIDDTLEQLQPGLPELLGSLEYRRDSWRDGLAVIQAVAIATHKNSHRP